MQDIVTLITECLKKRQKQTEPVWTEMLQNLTQACTTLKLDFFLVVYLGCA